MGILELLTTVFVTLKLVGTIDWSWWKVTSPIWGGYTVILCGYLAFYLAFMRD